MLKKLAAIFMMTATVSVFAQAIVTESTSNSTTNSNSKSETTVKSPPPSAIAPSINSMNNDLCTVGVSGAAQTQILGIAIGSTFRDENCERLKLARILNDFGMKVAAVAILCQDERVFEAMIQAGTVCPIDGKIGKEAKELWNKYDHERPDYSTYIKRMKDREKIQKDLETETLKELEKQYELKAKEEIKIEKINVR